MSIFDKFKIIKEGLSRPLGSKEEAEERLAAIIKERKRIQEETRNIKPSYYFFEGGIIVRLTGSGYKKVGRRIIYSTDEQVRPRGQYLYVTDRDSGKTYIFNPDTDIESIDQE